MFARVLRLLVVIGCGLATLAAANVVMAERLSARIADHLGL